MTPPEQDEPTVAPEVKPKRKPALFGRRKEDVFHAPFSPEQVTFLLKCIILLLTIGLSAFELADKSAIDIALERLLK